MDRYNKQLLLPLKKHDQMHLPGRRMSRHSDDGMDQLSKEKIHSEYMYSVVNMFVNFTCYIHS